MRPGRAADHSPPSSAEVMEEYSYNSTHPLGHNRACNGNTLPFTFTFIIINIGSISITQHFGSFIKPML